jgi:predicted dehydrogenase
MTSKPIGVGIIGAAPDRGWAANAHIPALRAMPDYSLAAVCTTRQESAEATARKFGIPAAFADWRALIVQPEVDLVIVTVKVLYHRELILGALAAGKHVFCEWPLGLNTTEAEEMLAAARKSGRRHMVGLQGRFHPVLMRLGEMVRDGVIGRLLSVTLTSSLSSWGPRLSPAEAYRADRAGGATGLTVPGGHSLDTLAACVGPFREFNALLSTQHKETEIIGTGRVVPVNSPDQVLLSGTLDNGAVASVHIKADMAVPMGVRLEINGAEGDLLVVSRTVKGQNPVGLQRAELVLSHAKRGSPDYVEIAVPPDGMLPAGMPPGAPHYTARLLARLADAIRTGSDTEPNFADAVECHRLLDAVQLASDTGQIMTCPGPGPVGQIERLGERRISGSL